jgi:polyisoprenoid-binding protein YceI
MTTTPTALTAGTWTIDPVHSEVGFSVRHMMISKVRGKFSAFSGTIVVGDDPLSSSVEASIEVASIDTGDDTRDNHLRSADFFDVEHHPNLVFRSTAVRPNGSDYQLDGELTIRGTTRPVTLDLELNGVGPDPWGGTRAGFSARTSISRKDFGMEFNIPIDGGGVVVGDKVDITLEIEAVLATS